MTPSERYRAFMHRKTDGIPMCHNCKHYYQYYVKLPLAFHPASDGYCAHPRIKNRMPFDLCTHYDPKEETA